jgi:hypothetical protein
LSGVSAYSNSLGDLIAGAHNGSVIYLDKNLTNNVDHDLLIDKNLTVVAGPGVVFRGTFNLFNVNEGCTLTLINLSVVGFKDSHVIVNNGVLNLINCSFSYNNVKSVVLNKGSLFGEGSVFENNTGVASACIENCGNCSVVDSNFRGNKANGNGAVFGHFGGYLNIIHCIITNNKADGDGGVVYSSCYGSSLNCSGSWFDKVDVISRCNVVNVSDSEISNNYCGRNGAVFYSKGHGYGLNFHNNVVKVNTAGSKDDNVENYGGVICCSGDVFKVNVDMNEFKDNSADYGSVVHSVGSYYLGLFKNNTLSGNKAILDSSNSFWHVKNLGVSHPYDIEICN